MINQTNYKDMKVTRNILKMNESERERVRERGKTIYRGQSSTENCKVSAAVTSAGHIRLTWHRPRLSFPSILKSKCWNRVIKRVVSDERILLETWLHSSVEPQRLKLNTPSIPRGSWDPHQTAWTLFLHCKLFKIYDTEDYSLETLVEFKNIIMRFANF